MERLRELEGENSSLTREGESQRKQYERCLDDVASQVVRALLAQKVTVVKINIQHTNISLAEVRFLKYNVA